MFVGAVLGNSWELLGLSLGVCSCSYFSVLQSKLLAITPTVTSFCVRKSVRKKKRKGGDWERCFILIPTFGNVALDLQNEMSSSSVENSPVLFITLKSRHLCETFSIIQQGLLVPPKSFCLLKRDHIKSEAPVAAVPQISELRCWFLQSKHDQCVQRASNQSKSSSAFHTGIQMCHWVNF